MQKTILTYVACLFLIRTSGQEKHPVMIFAGPGFSQTLKDRTKENNLNAVGIGLQVVFATRTMISPIIDIKDDFVFSDDKVFRTNAGGIEQKAISNVLKLLAGINVSAIKYFYASMSGGPCFINGQTLPGIEPAVGAYFPGTKRWMVKVSYTNIFNRNSGEKENYSSLSLSVAIRIF